MAKQIIRHSHYKLIFSNKRNKLLIYTTTWVDFKSIMLSDKAELKKSYTVQVYLHKIIKSDKVRDIKKRLVVARD